MLQSHGILGEIYARTDICFKKDLALLLQGMSLKLLKSYRTFLSLCQQAISTILTLPCILGSWSKKTRCFKIAKTNFITRLSSWMYADCKHCWSWKLGNKTETRFVCWQVKLCRVKHLLIWGKLWPGLISVCTEPSERGRYLNIVRVDKTKLGILNDLPFVGGILGHNLCLASLQTC